MKLEIYYYELGRATSKLRRDEATLQLLIEACELAESVYCDSQKADDCEKELDKLKFKGVRDVAWDISGSFPEGKLKMVKALKSKGYFIASFEESSFVILNKTKFNKNVRELVDHLTRLYAS